MSLPAIRLRYIGQGAAAQHWVAGWPAEDHDEPDQEVAVQKVASGLYDVVGSADEDRDLSQRAQRKLERAADAAEPRQAVLAGDPLPGAEVDENARSTAAGTSEPSGG